MIQEDPLETTLGELVEALTEETVRYVRDEREVNILVAYMLTDLFCKAGRKSRRWH